MKLWVLSICLALVLQAGAEYRIWTGRDGGQVLEAEYLRLNGGLVYLNRQDGTTTKVPLDKLCDDDIYYVQLKNPPKLKVSVDVEEHKGAARKESFKQNGVSTYRATVVNKYSCDVTIERCDKRLYDPSLTCRLFWLSSRLLPQSERDGSHMREVVILKEETQKFKPADINSKSREWNWSSGNTDYKCIHELITSGKGWTFPVWDRYFGYLLVVLDEQGNVIAISSDDGDLKEIVDEILVAKIGEGLFKVGVRD